MKHSKQRGKHVSDGNVYDYVINGKYAHFDGESWDQISQRVAVTLAQAERSNQTYWTDKFYNVIKHKLFLPGGRILANAGRLKQNLFNCYIRDIQDSIKGPDGWADTLATTTEIMAMGGGVGLSFDKVRPRSATIVGVGGHTNGSVAFMQSIDALKYSISGGKNRGIALLFGQALNHPDIIEFIRSKKQDGVISAANISILIDNAEEFVQHLNDPNYEIELIHGGKVYHKLKLVDIIDDAIANMIENGEPGFINRDFMEEDSNISYVSQICCTNPCFAKETLVPTKTGVYQIQDLVGKSVKIMSNNKWVVIDNFRMTARNQDMLKVTLQDGSEIKATPYHKFILEDGSRVETQYLNLGQKLLIKQIESHGTHEECGAYLKGFLIGDGHLKREKSALYLYWPKFTCSNRLIASANEVQEDTIHPSIIRNVEFLDGDKRRIMTGLTARSNNLSNWCSEYKTSLPKEIFIWNKKSKLNFIAGIMDADGTAFDTKNGFAYQICSIHKKWLLDFQHLLKTISVQSKFSLMKKEGMKDFNDGYGKYKAKDCYCLTISQASSIKLSSQVKFERLVSFKDKECKYVIKPKFNTIISITQDKIAEKVYCCTVPKTHSFVLNVGIEIGQCGELPHIPNGCCDLGSYDIAKFVMPNGRVNWNLLKDVVRTSVRMLDNAYDVTTWPNSTIQRTNQQLRKLGLGIMGAHHFLIKKGIKYSDQERAGETLAEVMKNITITAYWESIELAKEKGQFEALDREKFIENGFCRKLPRKLKENILEYGIRNCGLTSIAPTGTISIAAETSPGLEPCIARAMKRRYNYTFKGNKIEYNTCNVIDPLWLEIYNTDKAELFEEAVDISLENHFYIQAAVQHWVDSAVSKTVNFRKGEVTVKQVKHFLKKYFPRLKGFTMLPEGSRKDAPQQPVTENIWKKWIEDGNYTTFGIGEEKCKNGVCEV